MDISALVNEQREYFMKGATLDYSFRLTALQKLSAAITEMESEIVAALTADLNKSEIEGFMTEIGTVQGEIKYAIRNLSKWMKKMKVKTPLMLFPAKCYVVPEPFGVALIMSPWNYPFMLSISPCECDCGGNCAVIKPSAYTPTVAGVIEK